MLDAANYSLRLTIKYWFFVPSIEIPANIDIENEDTPIIKKVFRMTSRMIDGVN